MLKLVLALQKILDPGFSRRRPCVLSPMTASEVYTEPSSSAKVFIEITRFPLLSIIVTLLYTRPSVTAFRKF
jgi:hypothetical protein